MWRISVVGVGFLVSLGVATSQAQTVSLPKTGTNTVLTACTVTLEVGQQDCEPVLCTGFKKEALLNPRVNQTGRVTFETELISMELTGVSPSLGTVTVRAGQQHGLEASLGGGTSLSNNAVFPADSFFDVFCEVDLPNQGLTGLRNAEPVRLQNTIRAFPAISTTLTNNTGAVTLFGSQQQVTLRDIWLHQAVPGREIKLALSGDITNGVLNAAQPLMTVCPTNNQQSATVTIRRQVLRGPLLSHDPCDEVLSGNLVFEAVLDRNLRAPDWRGFHKGKWRILEISGSVTNVFAIGKLI